MPLLCFMIFRAFSAFCRPSHWRRDMVRKEQLVCRPCGGRGDVVVAAGRGTVSARVSCIRICSTSSPQSSSSSSLSLPSNQLASAMDEDLGPTLRNHQIQLQQVLAALEADPENTELQEMREELEEVIRLTKELMTPAAASRSAVAADSSAGSSGGYRFRAGDKVQAPWSEDGMYYEAVIDDVMSDGQCTVSFATATLGLDSNSDGKHRKGTVSEVCLVSLLKPSASCGSFSFKKPPNSGNDHGKDHPHKSVSREALKKKQQKRVQKLKEFDEEQEKVKNKWQQFSCGKKTSKKKGLTSATGSKNRVSIFASPDGVDGRVGIGTCGISGKGMTPYVASTSVGSSALSVPHKKKALSSGFPSALPRS